MISDKAALAAFEQQFQANKVASRNAKQAIARAAFIARLEAKAAGRAIREANKATAKLTEPKNPRGKRCWREPWERAKHYGLKSCYGLTLAIFYTMFAEQQGNCASCARPMVIQAGKINSAVVDHCHSTGKVRGLLCSGCNAGLGALREDPDVMRKLIQYIDR